MPTLDARIAELAAKYLPLAKEMLAEAIRIPADYVDKPVEQGGDPLCGTSNHEFPRLEYLRKKIIEIKAVRKPEDVFFDGFGNLVWWVEDPNDGIEPAKKKVVYIDGHTDTVKPLRAQWKERVVGADCYDGLIDKAKIDKAVPQEGARLGPARVRVGAPRLRPRLGGPARRSDLGGHRHEDPRRADGRGRAEGAIVRSYGTACEEDNDGAGPMYLNREVFPTAGPEVIPDVVILTDGTGCSKRGALGIYRGQRGRMQIEVTVTGKSCHGSMPWEGKNPFEYGGAIVKEAAEAYEKRDGFLDDPFLGHGTRTASWARLDTPSDCAVPEKLVFRFDRRLTIGETPEQAVADVDRLSSVAAAREAGLKVDVSVPVYTDASWKGYVLNNPQIYLGWVTPEEHPSIRAAVESYEGVVSPHVDGKIGEGGVLTKEPRVERWVFSTDGVGFPVPKAAKIPGAAGKAWVESGPYKYPAMLGFGPGIEQNTHKIGECLDAREMQHCAAFLARYPSVLVGTK